MLEVDIEKIIPITDARDRFNQIIEEVEASDDMYVVTKNGKPSAIIVGVHHLEKLTGNKLPTESFSEEKTDEPVASATPSADNIDAVAPIDEPMEEKPVDVDSSASAATPVTAPTSDSADIDSYNPKTTEAQDNQTDDLFETPKDEILAAPTTSTPPVTPTAPVVPAPAEPVAAAIAPTAEPAPVAKETPMTAPAESATSPIDEPLPEENPASTSMPSTPFPNSFPSTMPAPTPPATPVTPPTPPTPPVTSI
ncbi:MAG: type II toxin-antitoxin system Phd/YefM family antitoxin [Patescibacteria group bacterium]|jgi:prevent-host-death family protein